MNSSHMLIKNAICSKFHRWFINTHEGTMHSKLKIAWETSLEWVLYFDITNCSKWTMTMKDYDELTAVLRQTNNVKRLAQQSSRHRSMEMRTCVSLSRNERPRPHHDQVPEPWAPSLARRQGKVSVPLLFLTSVHGDEPWHSIHVTGATANYSISRSLPAALYSCFGYITILQTNSYDLLVKEQQFSSKFKQNVIIVRSGATQAAWRGGAAVVGVAAQ